MSIWAFQRDDNFVFNTTIGNNPVGTITNTIGVLMTDFPPVIQLGAGLGAFSV